MKKQIRLDYLFFGLIGFFLTGCDVVNSSQVSSSANYSSYSATYDEQAQSIEYDAHFSVGGDFGTTIELDQASTVRIDQVGMNSHRSFLFNDVSYEAFTAANASELSRTHEFYFHDQDGHEYRNQFTFPSLVEVDSNQPSSASLNQKLTLRWVTQGSVDDDHVVTATLVRSDGKQTVYGDVKGHGSAGRIEFSAADLQSFGISHAVLKICHGHATSQISASRLGGSLTLSTCSRIFNLTLN